MNPRKNAELEEALVGCFDSFVAMALDEASIPSVADDTEHMTDRFVLAADVERRAALRLYPVVQKYLMSRFRQYVEEEQDLGFDESLVRIDDKTKAEILFAFTFWYGTMSLRDFLSDKKCSFNPLYLTEWCDGLAIMYVQNEQRLREKILELLLEDLFMKKDMTTTDFLKLPFDRQEEFYKNYHGLIVAIFQALGNSLPDEVSNPVG